MDRQVPRYWRETNRDGRSDLRPDLTRNTPVAASVQSNRSMPSDILPRSRPVTRLQDGKVIHATVAPLSKPKPTFKLLWQSRPRSMADARYYARAAARFVLGGAKKVAVAAIYPLRHPLVMVKKLARLPITLALNWLPALARTTWNVITNPRKTYSYITGFIAVNWQPTAKATIIAVILAAGGLFFFHYFTRFNVAPNALSLLPRTSVQTKFIQSKDGFVSYSAASDNSVRNKLVLADPTNATNGSNLYEASFGLDPSKGLTFSQTTPGSSQPSSPIPGLPNGAGQSDAGGKLSFHLAPIGGGVQQSRLVDNRVQRPSAGGQRFYTFRKNGVAEDILLSKAPGDTAQYQWKLDLPSSLEARMMADGSVGIYSANPNLFGNIQVGDQKSQALLDKARKNGTKDTLAFVLPAPFIKTMDRKTDFSHTKFSLTKNNILTLTATSLKKFSYPISIDPSVVVTTTGDFQKGYDDGMIDYGNLTANAITRNNISGGAVGAASAQTFTTNREYFSALAYNGYLYVLGGSRASSGTGCTAQSGSNYYCNDILYAPFCTAASTPSGCPSSNWQGALGTFTQQTGSFTGARNGFGAAVYNGYLYLTGGWNGSGYYDDIQYCPLNSSTGAIGDGISGNNECTRQTGFLPTARSALSATVNNGYIYLVGGYDSGDIGTILYCRIKADGSVSACTNNATGLNTARNSQAIAVYNNYLYVTGGLSSNVYQNDIEYCHLNTDGSAGACTQTANAFTTARAYHTAGAHEGYLYIEGGYTGSGTLNDLVYCPFNPNGSVGVCTTQSSAFSSGHTDHAMAIYNGYIYLVSGWNGTADNTDIQRAQIQPMGALGAVIQQGTFTTTRDQHASVVYNGFLYIVGGYNGSANASIIYCPLGADGSVGTCIQQTTTGFPSARDVMMFAGYNGYLYMAGGSGSSTFSDVVYSQMSSTGPLQCPPGTTCTTGVFTQIANALPAFRSDGVGFAYNGFFYVAGGNAAASPACAPSGTVCNDVLRSQINPSTGALSCPSGYTCSGSSVFTQQADAFATPRNAFTASIYNGYVYIAGGQTGLGGTDLNDIQYSKLNSNGTLSCPAGATCSGSNVFATAQTFTTALNGVTSVATNGNLYILGGAVTVGAQNTLTYCPLAANGSVGTCTTLSSPLAGTRLDARAVTYGGYIYLNGGLGTGTGCTSSYCNDVQRFWVGQMGQVGTNTANGTGFTTARYGQSSVVYSNYLYIIGGHQSSINTACNTSSSNVCGDIQFCPFNGDGSLGTCRYTHAGLDDGTSFVANAFTTPRYEHTSVVYNGYLYIIGGNAGSNQNDVQYCPLNSNGTVSTCTQQTGAFTTVRRSHTSVVYNGYLYVIGGAAATNATGCNASGACNDIQYATINANGSLSCPSGATCSGGTVFTQQLNAFTTPRYEHTSVVYNGYLYIIGGYSGSSYQNDIQYCPINSDGSVGTCTQEVSAFTTIRHDHTSVVYNGYLYIIGGEAASSSIGCNASGFCNDIQYCQLNTNGSVGACSVLLSGFTTPRFLHASVVSNGYLYITGGCSAGICTTYQSDIQYLPLSSSPILADYEHTFDTTYSVSTIQSISYGRNASTDDVCGEQLWYATAGSNGQFGSWTVIPQAIAGTNYTINAANKEYLLAKLVLDDQTCGGTSNISDITITYTIPPSVPAVTAPANASTGLTTLTPDFRVSSSQAQNHYLQYEVQVYQSNCSTLLKDANQTTDQTSWFLQDMAGSTAYKGDAVLANSTVAKYTYNGVAINWGTTYCWRAQAYDAQDTNNGSSGWTGFQTFTTNYAPSAPTLTKPVSSENGVSVTPEFRFYSTDQDSNYLTYEVDIYDATCTTPITGSPFDQNSSQVGWSSQSANGGAAYTSGQTAIYKLQTALSANTTYCWKARAKDPAGTNTFGSFSGTQTFTTGTNGSTTQKAVTIKGNVNIGGGDVIIRP